MKSKVLGVGLGSTIFIFLAIAVLALIRPVYVRLYGELSRIEEIACKKLEEETGLSLSYKSLSPSILAGANMKKIAISDVASKKTVLTIKKARLSYKITKFFSKNPVLALESLSLNGVEVEFDAVKDSAFVEKIQNLLKKNGSGKKSKNENSKNDGDKSDSENDLKSSEKINAENADFSFEPGETENGKIETGETELGEKTEAASEIVKSAKKISFPFDIIVKNVSVHYSDQKNELFLTLKNLNLKDFERSDSYSVKSSGAASFLTDALKSGGRRQKIACGFTLSGNIFPSLDGSSALLSLSNSRGADYSLSNLDLLLNYSQNILEVRTMRTVLPFSVYAKGDFEKMEFGFQGEFDLFNPFSLVSVRKKTEIMQKINGSTISGNFSASFSSKNINYDSNLRLALSQNLFGEKIDFRVLAKGDKNYVSVSKISASGDTIDAEFSGGFNIASLQPSGTLSLNFFRLKNGGIISTEIYVDPLSRGFMCFSPQIFFNDMSLTAAQLTVYPEKSSVDFSFEFFDYAHMDYENAGHFVLDGSFLTSGQKFLQASVSISDMFVDSVIQKAAFFLDENLAAWLNTAASVASPYVFNTEAYISSDFKDFSVNAPLCLLANTKKDRELLIFALDGSKETFNISQFDLQFGNIEAHAQSSVDFADNFKNFSFSSDLTVNSIPYRFSGSVSPEWISISGDYDFDAIVSFGEKISGSVSSRLFPVAAGKYVFALSFDTDFSWDLNEGISAEIASFELEEPSLNLPFAPHLVFSGSANRYGFMFNTLAYSDSVSSLDGSGTFVWNLNNGIFDSIHANIDMSSLVSSEKFNFSADFTNPSQLPFSAEALKNDFYMSVSSSMQNFPCGRFLSEQTSDDTISAEITATGTIKNPLISVNLERAQLSLYGYPLNASASVVYDDTGLNVNGMECSWSLLNLSNFNASFDPFSFSGEAQAKLDVRLNNKSIEMPLSLNVSGAKESRDFSVPEFLTAELKSDEVGGNFFASKFPFKLTGVRAGENIEVFADDRNVFNASFSKQNGISANVNSKTVKFSLDGTIIKNELDLAIKGIYADMKRISSEIEIPAVHFNSGIVTGALKISGITTDPEFTGAFSIEKPNLNIPYISRYAFSAPRLFLTAGQGEAHVEPTPVFLGNGYGLVGMVMEFDRWGIESIDVSVDVDDAHKVPVEMSFPFVFVKGDGSCQLDILYTVPNEISISGWITGDNTDVEIVTTSLQKQFSLENISQSVPVKAAEPSSINVFTDLDITVGQKVQVLFNPLMRGVVTPGTALSLFIDSATGEFELKSDISLRGGEIVWLNRNFYMKEGRIALNETQDRMAPKITVRAETRERDESGNMVTIVMSANNEPLSTFTPHFSSVPAKSEKEIMELLGNIVSADSENVASLAVAGGDYFMQATLMRKIENTLRETLNFDIFSIRTNVLQNSVKFATSRDSSNHLSFGNFIDNSTVYVGKYFGSSIYVDSLLHWTYDEDKAVNGTYSGDIVFQPEFGFEMTSPFVNIRIGVAPDIDEIRRGITGTWVPSTSMTLSWKHSF